MWICILKFFIKNNSTLKEKIENQKTAISVNYQYSSSINNAIKQVKSAFDCHIISLEIKHHSIHFKLEKRRNEYKV